MKVICMGSATTDLFITIDHPFMACSAGEKLLMHDLEYMTGGGGSNAAVSLSRLGISVGYLGKTGDGVHAQRILEEFKKEKVKVLATKKSKNHTAFSIVVESNKEKDRLIYVHKGATDELSSKDFSLKNIHADWLYLASVMGSTFVSAKKVVAHMKKQGSKILFNPSSYMIRNLDLKPILRQTNVLVLNKEEAELLTKKKLNINHLGELLKKLGPEIVIITDGARGVHYFDALHKFHVKSRKVKPVSTTGAGDAFTSGFLGATIKGEDAPHALKIGILNACSVIQKRGAKNGLLSWREVNKK